MGRRWAARKDWGEVGGEELEVDGMRRDKAISRVLTKW